VHNVRTFGYLNTRVLDGYLNKYPVAGYTFPAVCSTTAVDVKIHCNKLMYDKLYLVDRLLDYVQNLSIRYPMCAVITNYIVYYMHALGLPVTSRPKLYIFNVSLTPMLLFLNLCSSEIRVDAK